MPAYLIPQFLRCCIFTLAVVVSALASAEVPKSFEDLAVREADEFAALLSKQTTVDGLRKEANKMLYEASQELATNLQPSKVTGLRSTADSKKFQTLSRKMNFAHELTQALGKGTANETTELTIKRAMQTAKAGHVARFIQEVNRVVDSFKHFSKLYTFSTEKGATGAAESLAKALESRFGTKVETVAATEIMTRGLAYRGLAKTVAGGLVVATVLTSWPVMAADEALSARTLGNEDPEQRDPSRFVDAVNEAARLAEMYELYEADLDSEVFRLRQMLDIDRTKSWPNRNSVEHVFKLIINDPETIAKYSTPPNIEALVKKEGLESVFGPLFRKTMDDDDQLAIVSISGRVIGKRIALNKFMSFYTTNPEVKATHAYLKRHNQPITFGLNHSDYFTPCAGAPGGYIPNGARCADYTNFTKPLGYQERSEPTSPARSESGAARSQETGTQQESNALPLASTKSVQAESPTSTTAKEPSSQLVRQPSSQPVRQPSSQPVRQPSSQPAKQPSSQPVRQPSSQPAKQPSSQPDKQQSSPPSNSPSRYPYAPTVR